MIEEIKDRYILEGIEIGEARGEARGQLKEKINDILTVLQTRCGQVPSDISEELNRRKDLVALQSLFILALQCNSSDEFAKALK